MTHEMIESRQMLRFCYKSDTVYGIGEGRNTVYDITRRVRMKRLQGWGQWDVKSREDSASDSRNIPAQSKCDVG